MRWRSKYFVSALFASLSAGAIARADGKPPSIEWPGWRVESSEYLNLETNDTNVRSDNTVAFPMTNLVDGDPKTAWVWRDPSTTARKHLGTSKRVRSFTLEAGKPVRADELWLMNGYNRRADLFRRNDRVLSIRLNIDGKDGKTVTLSDRMGWHKIALRARPFRTLRIELIGIRKGDGPDNDICLSELALVRDGRAIDFKMPQAVIYNLSACCGGTGHLLSRSGRVLARGGFGEGLSLEWSPSGRYVAGSGTVSKQAGPSNRLWVADAHHARVIYSRLQTMKTAEKIRWAGNHALAVWSGQYSQPPRPHRQIIRLRND